MTEKEFFGHLEFRVCRELSGMRDENLQVFWCDGFIPEEFGVIGNRCRITGRIWMARGGKHQECWTFALMLGGKTTTRENIDWETIMPQEDVTGWLSLDFKTKYMKVDPFSSRPDPEPVAT